MSAAAKEYQDRSPAHRDQILELLKEAGPAGVRNVELNCICFRYGARIWELRKAGHKIKTVSEARGMFRFILTEEAPAMGAQAA